MIKTEDYEKIYNETERIYRRTETKGGSRRGFSSARWNGIFECLVAERIKADEKERKEFLSR